MRESFAMQAEMQKLEPQFIALEGAEGTIQHGEKHDINVVNELTERVQTGEFHVKTDKRIPCKCIDGRICEHATEGPNAAGGTETIFVAYDLTEQVPIGPKDTVANGMRRIIQQLQEQSYPVGGHSDEHHADPEDSGCGANDRLEKIYGMMVRKPAVVKQYVEAILGLDVDETTEQLILGNAEKRADFSRGNEVLEVFKNADGSQLETLEGSHDEVVAIINKVPGTTLDRKQLAETFGPEYQAFNVDAWSFPEAAQAITDPGKDYEVLQKIIAMTYYNVATALVLCGQDMRVVFNEAADESVAA